MTKNQRGALFVTIAMAVYTINDVCLKLVSARLPASEIMVLRGVLCVTLAYFWVRYEGQTHQIKAAFTNPLLIFRSFTEALCAFLFIGAVSLGAIGDMTAIGLTTPLFITALSIFMLKERVSLTLWGIILIGLVGMLFVMKPTGGSPLTAGLLALGSAVVLAFREVITRKIKHEVSSTTVLLTSAFGVMFFAFIPALFQPWFMPTLREIFFMMIAACTVLIGNFFMISSHRDTDISTIAPFRYSILIWAIIAGFFIWNERPDFWSMIGMGLIVSSGLYTLKTIGAKN